MQHNPASAIETSGNETDNNDNDNNNNGNNCETTSAVNADEKPPVNNKRSWRSTKDLFASSSDEESEDDEGEDDDDDEGKDRGREQSRKLYEEEKSRQNVSASHDLLQSVFSQEVD